jgi:hypothetical protein
MVNLGRLLKHGDGEVAVVSNSVMLDNEDRIRAICPFNEMIGKEIPERMCGCVNLLDGVPNRIIKQQDISALIKHLKKIHSIK